MNKRSDHISVMLNFMYQSSHDVKGPVLSMQMLIDMINDDEKNAKEYLPLMKKHLNKIESFITSFEEYSHICGKVENFRRIRFQSLFSEILTENKFVERYPQVRYQFNLLKAKSFVSDYRKVKIALKHLLANAFHFSSTSEDPQVSVTIISDGSQSEIQIWNNGCFIEENVGASIFKLFFRGSNYSEGSGTGLFLIKECIKKLKGNIFFSSTKEKGTTINITIPDLEMENNEGSILPYTSSRYM